MNLLLDTQAVLWWKSGHRKLGPRARRLIESEARAVVVSAASAWEMAIKSAVGRLALKTPLARWMPDELRRDGMIVLSVTIEHAVRVAQLPLHHADPFDRMLIAQAQAEDLTILTSDEGFDRYDVPVIDARR